MPVNASLWLIQLFILEILYSTICLTNWTFNQIRCHFIRQANLLQFHGDDSATEMKLFKAYCLSLYGCALWRLNAHDLHALNVSFNNVIRQIWKLPYNCHTSIAHSVRLTTSIYNIIYSRFIRLLSTAVSHPSNLICSVFHDSSLACNSGFVGYNCMYGNSHGRSYSINYFAVGH